ncbi:MAG: tRNA (N(6)-L-threonylcarbamoyladenosine(37)-C(2))-methylthiotransferase MtaB [Bacillota bacterium]
MKVAFHTLGCKVNQNDTQGLASLFQEEGHTVVPFDEQADVLVVNTCAVTRVGEQKSRQIIRKAIDLNPEAVIVVTGCYAQTAPGEIAGIPGVSLVIGMADRSNIVKLVTEYKEKRLRQVSVKVAAIEDLRGWTELPVGSSEEHERTTRAMLKVEEGCEEFCSYCIVPYARGKVRSMPPEQVLKEFTTLVEKGFREIVLTGIHLGQYGRDLGVDLHDLLERILKLNKDCRIRLGSLEPVDLKNDLLDTIINNPQICQHLHIPLQSGSDRILKLMNRNYSLSFFANLINKIRAQNPLVAVGTDLIVGFPGESEEDFSATCNFIKEQAFSRIHVFRYSPRQGTPAAGFPGRIPKAVQEERSRLVQKIAADLAAGYARKFLHKSVEVLFEEQLGTCWSGLSGEYLRVLVAAEENLKNSLKTVVIKEIDGQQLRGSLITQ